ncbi:dephospho-CoA kinase [Flavobacterium crassostreae]|uniref:Dephospho-CoA kinase n=1 Tax=Flavobacterium crassostreae TaxID=1763534 RepID=A0A1B9E9I7_9FLAO|nr:dephospho-CoA kinase [Flavobacterium crassostreae]OCB78609.1 dephospho-CoA kinase [Flavobacterium crassostreae]
MTKIVGLTGGIGSGKTTIAKHFELLGVPIYIADEHARQLMQSKAILEALKQTFGTSIFEAEQLHRPSLAAIVFQNPAKLQQLNAIVHPAVQHHFQHWLLSYTTYPYVIYEAAILFESGNYQNCHSIICVTAPLESRIERVIERDHTTRALVEKRIAAQWTDAQRISKSDFVIENLDLELAKENVEKIHKILMIKQNDL